MVEGISSRMIHYAPEALHRVIVLVMAKLGSNAREQKLVADHLVEANLTGHDSHGVGMIPAYVKAAREQKLAINARPSVIVDQGPILTLDGGMGLGQVIAFDAMDRGIARAHEVGMCMLGLRNTHHTGRIGHWSEQCAAAGFVSMHYVSGFAGVVSVAPFGGREARFQTNPYSAGFPIPGGDPIILDFATSKIAMGKVRVALNKGESVPEGCLVDSEGVPSVDPDVMYRQGAERGALMTFGEHKGSGLALICELFAGALTGGTTTRPGNYEHRPITNNMLSIIVDPRRLGGGDTVAGEARSFIAWVKSSKPARGSSEVLVPGEPERQRRTERRRDGIPVDARSWNEILEAGKSIGLTADTLENAARS